MPEKKAREDAHAAVPAAASAGNLAGRNMDLAERAAHFGYWRLELATGEYYWSPGMYRILEADPSMKANVEWIFDQIRPEDRAVVETAVAQAIKTRAPFSYRVRSRHPERSVRIVDTQGQVEIGPDGRVTSVLGVCHDVSKQIHAEEAREKAQEMYRVMAEQASDVIMLYAPGGRILFASNALERVLKRKTFEIEEGRFYDLVHPDDRDEAQKIRVRPKPNEIKTAVYRIRRGDGAYIWLETTTRGVFDENTGEYKNLISVSRDVTQRKTYELEIQAARERAEAANRAKSTFLANMSHELRTPLNAIIGFAELMRQRMFGTLGSPRYEEYATLIYDSGQLLLDLISDVLDMAKIEAGKMDMNLEHIDVKQAAEDCTRLLRQRADATRVTLAASLPDEPVSIVADRRAFKQVILNLLSNALKFTPQGGRVELAVRLKTAQMILSVRDTGIGIPESELSRLGQPFEQVCADPMLAKAGTGLGLALVRALAERHGGAMKIASKEGQGTEVTVELPLTQAKRVAA
jgi:PAS domain S-box-containing protein